MIFSKPPPDFIQRQHWFNGVKRIQKITMNNTQTNPPHKPDESAETANVVGTDVAEKTASRTPDYSHAWAQFGLSPRMFSLPVSAPAPRLTDSGILILYRWRGDRANVTLYRRHDGHYGIKCTITQSGKSITARISECDVPPFLSLAEFCERAGRHGYLRLRQPMQSKTKTADEPSQQEFANVIPVATTSASSTDDIPLATAV